jgi:cysteinyl-tRNA synthetase
VYDDAHIGHARTHVAFDVIRRYLEYRGYDVTFVQNITDVDDKIINAANAAGRDFLEHGELYHRRAEEDFARLGVRGPDKLTKVTESMQDIIEIIQHILDNDHAYVTEAGSVYFRVLSMPDYGKLSNQSVKDVLAGARVEPGEEKKHPADFALWKAAKPDEPAWDSPWGKGRPGWHIECSAMSERALGQPFDIHGGGRDLIFPHHENEVAQSEAAYHTPFSKYWLHTGFLQVEGEKMSKSLGNFITVRKILEDHDPDAVRYFYVLTHYRSPIDFSEKGIKEAAAALERLVRTEELLSERLAGREYHADEEQAKAAATNDTEMHLIEATRRFRETYTNAMDDDFNTPEAVAALHAFAGEIRKALTDAPTAKQTPYTGPSRVVLAWVHHEFVTAAQVLSIFQDNGTETATGGESEARLIEFLLELRERARVGKDFATADLVRDRLRALGIEVQDTKQGAAWRRA